MKTNKIERILLAFAIFSILLLPASPYAQDGLVPWNKLGSQYQVHGNCRNNSCYFVTQIPDVKYIQAIHIRDEAPDEIIVATENIGATCGGGTPASIWKVQMDPQTGETLSLIKVQDLSKIQHVRGSLVESSDGTLFTGGGWCGYKPPYYSVDGGEIWESADSGPIAPPNSTFSFTEFNGQIYAGTGYDPWPGEIYRWLGNGDWEHVHTFPSPSRSVVYSMQVHEGRLFAGSWVYGWNYSTCANSHGVYVSSDGTTFSATPGIPSCYSVIHILEVEGQLISWVKDYYGLKREYVYIWNNDAWQELGTFGLSSSLAIRPVVDDNGFVYYYGKTSENDIYGIHRSADFGLTWQLMVPFEDTPDQQALYVFNNVLYIGLGSANSQDDQLYRIELSNLCIYGDLDCDNIVGRDDINIIRSYINQPAGECPECDINGDGTINILDARKLTLFCSNAGC